VIKVKVVLVGARGRIEANDVKLVHQIIDHVKEKYSTLVIVVSSCDKGVGRIVKVRNKKKQPDARKYEFDMIELHMSHYLQHELPRPEFTAHWNAVNATLVELGDEFHLLTEEWPKGTMMDLIKRIVASGGRYATYKPSESDGGVKECHIDHKK
jgi:hypothetical protein